MTTDPTRPRIVVDIKTPAVQKAIRMYALEHDTTIRTLVLEALADKYEDLAPLLIAELASET